MSEFINEELDAIIKKSVSESGMSRAQIDHITSQMIVYINNGSPYGNDPKSFIRWYQENGGKI